MENVPQRYKRACLERFRHESPPVGRLKDGEENTGIIRCRKALKVKKMNLAVLICDCNV